MTRFVQLLQFLDFRLSRFVLLIGWECVMLALPIIFLFADRTTFLFGVALSVLVQVAVVLAILYASWGIRRTAGVVCVVVLCAFLFEAIGTRTGFPFGGYDYTPALQPQFLHVPLLIPFAWLMMLPPAWAVSQAITHFEERNSIKKEVVFVVVSAFAFTAWDLFLDPQMVLWGLWEWHTPGGYFGIPWVNFLGWLFVSAIITALARPTLLSTRPLLVVYTLTWVFESVGLAVFWGLYGPALIGFLAMGFFAIWSWKNDVRFLGVSQHAALNS